MNGGKAAFPEFHSVYINPAALAEFEQTGAFPDGTVLVKELVSVGGKSATSGKGYFMGEFIGLEVAIKNAARFKDEPGNWAYFSFGHEYPLKDRTRASAGGKLQHVPRRKRRSRLRIHAVLPRPARAPRVRTNQMTRRTGVSVAIR